MKKRMKAWVVTVGILLGLFLLIPSSVFAAEGEGGKYYRIVFYYSGGKEIQTEPDKEPEPPFEISITDEDTTFSEVYKDFPFLEKKNSRFKGWVLYSWNNNGELVRMTITNEIKEPIAKYVDEEGKVELRAVWEEICKITVDFQNNTENPVVEIENVLLGTTLEELADQNIVLKDVEREDYIFKGWYVKEKNELGEETERYLDKQEKFQKDTEIYADWGKKTYLVTVNKNDGSASEERTYEAGTAMSEIIPQKLEERYGYIFENWVIKDEEGKEIEYAPKDEIQGNMTITANWKPVKCMVIFNGNGGSVDPASKEVNFGSTYGALPVPAREKYDFEGWYTAAAGGKKIIAEDVISTVEPQTLYAHWKEKEEHGSINVPEPPVKKKTPGKVKGLSVKPLKRKEPSVKLSWKKASDATHYQVYMKIGKKGKYKKVKEKVKKTSLTISVKVNKDYSFKVRAMNGDVAGEDSKAKRYKFLELKLNYEPITLGGIKGYKVTWKSTVKDVKGLAGVQIVKESTKKMMEKDWNASVTMTKNENEGEWFKIRAFFYKKGKKKVYGSWTRVRLIER